ncbi:hypothetical protein Pth03_60630 [Planotetraspora thailandica]|uniref:CHAT domain-containing protein n=1 Tax=Planotetraspora thailandica TaxID=487172 RepID=A0A8J3VB23_9ACTN|nr:CHAT domain-containing protein [Planotetraspora thailandica]GII57674.1 hypothetical protein Pth03_60630 [Planotetraspora thailandica]
MFGGTRRAAKQVARLATLYGQAVRSSDMTLFEHVRDESFELTERLFQTVAAGGDPRPLIDVARLSIACELGANDWRRTAIVGFGLGAGVGALAIREAGPEVDDRLIPPGVLYRMADVVAYSAHRAGWAQMGVMMIETITSCRVGDQMLERAVERLAATADGQAALRDALAAQRHLIEEVRGEPLPAPESATVPDGTLAARVTSMLADDLRKIRSAAASGGSYHLEHPGTYAFQAAAVSGRTLLYVIAGPRAGAVIKVGTRLDGSAESLELPGLGFEEVEKALDGIRTAPRGRTSRAARLHEVLTRVGAAVWGPVLERWPELAAEPVAVVPVGETALLPLFTAITSETPVCATIDLTVVPSARGLLLASSIPAGQAAGQAEALVAGDPSMAGPHRPLTQVHHEVAEVADVYRVPPVVLGEDGAPPFPELLDRLLSAGTLHLACHGVIDHSRPLASTLVLGPGLSLRDVWTRRFASAPLAVLSACDVGGIGDRHPGEQLGFPAVLLASGARSVIGALWPVPDSPDLVRLMRGLHERITGRLAGRLGGEPSNVALGREIGALHRDGVSPSVWGPFSHMGAA